MILPLGFRLSIYGPVRPDNFPCLVNDQVECIQSLPDLFPDEHAYQYVPGHGQRVGPVDFLALLALFVRHVFFPHLFFYRESIGGRKGHQKDFRMEILLDGPGRFPREFFHFDPALEQLVTLFLIPAVMVQVVKIPVGVFFHIGKGRA